MHVLIIGIGNPVPSFIQRRIKALLKAGIQITVVSEAGQRWNDLGGIQTLAINGQSTFFQQLLAVVRVLFSPHGFFQMLTYRPELKWKQRLSWAVKQFPLIRIQSPDIIHFQWLATALEYNWLHHHYKCPHMGSARGSQVTVYPLAQKGFKSTIEQAIHLVDYIHCVSNDIRQHCIHLGAPEQKLFVNYNGIDVSRFKPSESNHSNTDSLRLISVGALMWRKGFLFQLQALKILIEKGVRTTLSIVGSGPDEMGLRYLAHRLGIIPYINFEGQLEEQRIIAMLQQSDIYISTSAAEGLPNSLVEAAACGLPIVTFECEGAMEIVENETTGFIVPFGRVDRMANMIALLTDQEVRKRMGELARKKMENEFDESYWVTEMVSRYLEIARKHTLDAR